MYRTDWQIEKDREFYAERERSKRESAVRRARELSDVGERFAERTFATYLVPPGDAKALAAAQEVAEDGRRGLWLFGQVGNGKTHLAAAIVNDLNERGIPVPFVTSDRLLARLKSTYKGNGDESDVMNVYVSSPLLVLDDLDKVEFTKWSSQRLYTLVNGRYEKHLPIIVTSNTTPADLGIRWEQQGLDKTIADATFDRLREMCDRIIRVHGESYRGVKA